MNFNKLLKINFLFLFIILILAIIGTAALYSAGDGSFDPWAKKHFIRFFILFLILLIVASIDIKIIYRYTYTIFFLSLILLFSVEIIGTFGKGAERWINIFGVSIQPSELIKVSLIMALAKYYNELRFDKMRKVSNIIFPLILISLPTALVILQPDLGTSVTILILGLSLMFIAGVRLWKFIFSFIILIISFPFLWNNLKPYQQKRILSFFNPESDPMGQGYQLIQSKIALGSGGLTGKGFLGGTQGYLKYLPEKQTDFIFTLIGEEFGFLGVMFIIFLFFMLILIAIYISIKSVHIFGRILSMGVAINLFLYVVLNISMVSGLMPVVGIPLPLISYGGTAMLSIMLSFALLLNIELNFNSKKLDVRN